MRSRTPGEAAVKFVATFQKFASCVTDAVFDWRRPDPGSVEPHYLSLGGGRSVHVAGTSHLVVRIRLQFRIHHEHLEARITAYSYSLRDSQDREILAYQLHPTGQSHVRSPHLHIGPGAQMGRPDLAKAHLPTGLVGLNDFLRLLITEFGVRPRRKDWIHLLAGDPVR